jgi:hypothetical protein
MLAEQRQGAYGQPLVEWKQDRVGQHQGLEQTRLVRRQQYRELGAEAVAHTDQRRALRQLLARDAGDARHQFLRAAEALRRRALTLAVDVVQEQAVLGQEAPQPRPVDTAAEAVAGQKMQRRPAPFGAAAGVGRSKRGALPRGQRRVIRRGRRVHFRLARKAR